MKRYFTFLALLVPTFSLQCANYHKPVVISAISSYQKEHFPSNVEVAGGGTDKILDDTSDSDQNEDTEVTRSTGVENWNTIYVTTLTNESNNTYTISTPGNYALSGNITPLSTNDTIIINSNDVVLDLSGHTINGTGSTSAYAIRVAGKNNVTIRNGHIDATTDNAIEIDNTSNNVRIENITITNTTGKSIVVQGGEGIYIKNIKIANPSTTGIEFDTTTATKGVVLDNIIITGGTGGINLNGGTTAMTDVYIRNTYITNIAGETCYGLKCTEVDNAIVENCQVSNCTDDDSAVTGITFATCSNIKCINVVSGGHSGTLAYGFSLATVTGGYFEDCLSQRNTASSTSVNQSSSGFHLTSANACIFKNCISSDHVGGAEAFGWRMDLSSGNLFEGCRALRNSLSAGIATARVMGFYSKDGFGNTWNSCISNNHNAGNTAATNDGEGAVGFYVSTESQATFFKCTANGNGSSKTHASSAIGFYLDDTDGGTPADCTYCVVRDCEANTNSTTSTSGTTAYGFRDNSTDTTNIFIGNIAIGNTDNSSPRVTKNYSMDLPVGGTDSTKWPVVEGSMDGLATLNNFPTHFNVSITA